MTTEVLFMGFQPIIVEQSAEGFDEYLDTVDGSNPLWWRVMCICCNIFSDGEIWYD